MNKFFVWVLAVVALAWPCSAQLVVPPVTATCATSIDGSVVLVPNPLSPPVVTAFGFGSSLPPNTYFVVIAWYDAVNHVTVASPEVQRQIVFNQRLVVSPPTGMPNSAAGMQVFIGTTSGGETLQGTTVGSASYTQSIPLVTGAALPAVNTTVCQVIANDAGWPSGTGYVVTLTTPAGATLPGYPMQWQLLGPGQTVNLGNGLPLYNGTVTYPVPILARPPNHGPQSISGPLNLSGYPLTVGPINSSALASLLGGGVLNGNFLSGNATLSGTWGGNPNFSGNPVFSGTPVITSSVGLVLPNEGTTGTSVNTLTKLTGAPSLAVITATTDIAGIQGITVGGAGRSGNASIQQTGLALCVFDGPTTAGWYVVNSIITAGNCHATAFYPQGSQSVGRVLATNAGAGTYLVNLSLGPAFPAGGIGSVIAGSAAGTGGTANCVTPGIFSVIPCLNGGGIVSVTVGTAPATSSAIFILYFGGINSYVQSCNFFPVTSSANLATIEPQLTVNPQNGYVQLVSGATVLTTGSTYSWSYLCTFSAQ